MVSVKLVSSDKEWFRFIC